MKRIVFVLLMISVLSVFSFNFSVAADQEGDPITADAFDFFEETDKIDSVLTPLDLNGLSVNAEYSFTENLRPVEVGSRGDVYGTYDVFTDEDGTQFFFLYNTQMLCGIISYQFNEISDEDRIDENEAVSIADSFFSARGSCQTEFELESCDYNECSEEYLVKYRHYVDGFKTDETFDVWLDAAGNVFSYINYYKGRYNNLSISPSDYAAAESILDAELGNIYPTYEVEDEFVTIDDAGVLCLVKIVSVTISTDNDDTVGLEEHSVPIGQ